MKRILVLILMIIFIFSMTACKSKNNESTRITVSSYSKQLFDSKTQYIGDHLADVKILKLLSIKDELGSYQMELQTNQEPYIIKLNFKDTVEKRDEFDIKMQNNAFLILALIDNAGEVQWSYPSYENEEKVLITVYVNEANAKDILAKDIKEFGKSEVQLQELLDKLGINNTDSENNVQ